MDEGNRTAQVVKACKLVLDYRVENRSTIK